MCPSPHLTHREPMKAVPRVRPKGTFLVWEASCSFGSWSLLETTGMACLPCSVAGSRVWGAGGLPMRAAEEQGVQVELGSWIWQGWDITENLLGVGVVLYHVA